MTNPILAEADRLDAAAAATTYFRMAETPPRPRPNLTERAAAAQAERAAREAAALRANLQRRKQQSRDRAAEAEKPFSSQPDRD